ncbi:MAG: RNase N-terminal region, partial [Thermoleophilaceae bacterium]|nr:RNase N-terminal region [Thermoleophilaceae bacterium]
MQILLDVVVAGLVAGGVAGAIVLMGRSRAPRHAPSGAAAISMPARAIAPERGGDAPDGGGGGAALAVAADPATRAALREEIDADLRERRAEIARIEERLITKEEALQLRLEESSRRERSLEDRARNLDAEAEKLKAAKRDQIRELERVASLSTGQAR